jgi:glycosyltransferase involved in cell wall biosynthesis
MVSLGSKISMLVSIITSVLNGGTTVEDTIKSILSQHYKNIEYIVIDGCSTDNTIAIIQKYRSSITHFLSEPDHGVYDAMNKGLNLASGDIIGFLNADDVYVDSHVIQNIVEKMQTAGADCCYGDLVYINNQTHKVTRLWKSGEYKKGAFFHGWVLPHPVFFCKREIFTKFGGFNGDFQIAGDFELMLRFIERHQIKLTYIPKVLVKMRTGGKATRLRGILRGNWEIIRSFRMNGFRLSLWFFAYKPILKLKQLIWRQTSE